MRPTGAAAVVAAGAALAALAAAPRGASGQGVRGWASSSVRMVELRPVVQDSVGAEQVVVGEDGVARFEGRRVACVEGASCVFYRPLAPVRAWAGHQDVALTAWGLGVRGLSVTTLLRARTDFGSDFAWPRSDDAFDALLLYAELERGPLRFRAGRQETGSGLGFTGFDGLGVRWRGRAGSDATLGASVYGGRSLARGLSEPRDAALAGLEDFVPDGDAWLVGGSVDARLPLGSSATLRYQREIQGDRSGLVSERASLDVRTAAFAPVRLALAADWDFAFGRVGKAHATASWAPRSALLLELTGRRYVPYFELSTIWGFFEPVPYHEAGLRASWAPAPGLGVWAAGGWRSYGDTETSVFLSPLEGDGWRGEAGGSWSPRGDVALRARWEIDWLPGAFLSSADGSVTWTPRPWARLTATGTAFQRFEEFRVGEGRAWGGGLSGAVDVVDGVRLEAGGLAYRHERPGGAVDEPWSQGRGWVGLRVAFGEDPGLAARGRRRGGGLR